MLSSCYSYSYSRDVTGIGGSPDKRDEIIKRLALEYDTNGPPMLTIMDNGQVRFLLITGRLAKGNPVADNAVDVETLDPFALNILNNREKRLLGVDGVNLRFERVTPLTEKKAEEIRYNLFIYGFNYSSAKAYLSIGRKGQSLMVSGTGVTPEMIAAAKRASEVGVKSEEEITKIIKDYILKVSPDFEEKFIEVDSFVLKMHSQEPYVVWQVGELHWNRAENLEDDFAMFFLVDAVTGEIVSVGSGVRH